MYNNNIFGDRKITAEQAKLYEFISLPDQNLRINKEGNLSYNTTTKYMQYYDGSTWLDLDHTGVPTNLWEINSTTYIKPLSAFTDGIKVNKITPTSGTTLTIAGDLTSNETLKILDTTTPTKQIQIKYDLDAGYIQSLDSVGPTYKPLYINNSGGNCYFGNGTVDIPTCKINSVYERTTAAGITFNHKINVNDLYAHGITNQDMSLNMLGNGSLNMNFDSTGGIHAYQSTQTSALRNYFGYDSTHNLEVRYYGGAGTSTDDYGSLSYNYGGTDTATLKMQSKKIDARMTLLNTETGTFNIGQYNDGNQLQIGYYYDLSTAANRYAYIKYYGASTNALLFKQNGEVEGNMNKIYVDNLYEKTSSNGIICNNTLKTNNISSFGTGDQDLNFETVNNGCFYFNGNSITGAPIAKFYSAYSATNTSINIGQDDSYNTSLKWDSGGGMSLNLKYTTDKIILNSDNTGLTGNLLGIPITSSTISANNIVFSPTTLRNVVDNNLSTGVIGSIPSIIDNLDGTITCSQTDVAIRATNITTANLLFLTCPSAILTMSESAINYIYIIYAAGSAQYAASSSIATGYQTTILIAQVYRVPITESNELYINSKVCSLIQDLPKRTINFTGVKLNKINYESGGILSFSGVQFAITSGTFNMALNEFTTQAKTLTTNFKYLSNNAGVWSELTATNNINNTDYNGPSGFTAMTVNRWSVDFVFVTVDATTKYYSVKATSEATSLANALNITVPTLPQRLINNGILVGKIVFQKSQNINSVYSSFSSPISYQGITSHGNLSNLTVDDHPQYALLSGRTDETETLYINNISSFTSGTNKDMTFYTEGTGSYIFHVDPNPQAGKFCIGSPDLATGQEIDFYLGKGSTPSTIVDNMAFFGFFYNSYAPGCFSYFGLRSGGIIDKRLRLYASGDLEIPSKLLTDEISEKTSSNGVKVNHPLLCNSLTSLSTDTDLTLDANGTGEIVCSTTLQTPHITKLDAGTTCQHSYIQIIGDTVPNVVGGFGYSSTYNGLVYYDNVGLKLITSTIPASFSKSIDENKISKVEIKADRVITNFIYPKKLSDVVTVYNFGLKENSQDFQPSYGCLGVDDLGFWAMNKVGYKCYFVSNNSTEIDQKKNVTIQANNHVINDNMKQLKETTQKQAIEIKLLQKQMNDLYIEVEMLKKQMQKKNSTEMDINTDSPRNGLGNSLNFIDSYYGKK